MNLNEFTGIVRRCVDDYGMIDDGETVAVGVSGGKDSVSLLCALAKLRSFYPRYFNLHAVTLDMGFEGMDFSPIEDLCAQLGIPYTIKRTEIGRVIFNVRNEKNPCALCSKMRRGALNDLVRELGIKKIALAHNYNDAIETFLMALLYEGRLYCFLPITYMSRSEITQIRPMLYAREGIVKNLVTNCSLPIVENLCPQNGESKRQEIKTLIKTLGVSYPGLESKVFGAMQRLPLNGWKVRDRNKTEAK